MEKILGQDEIDKLFAKINPGAAQVTAGVVAPDVEAYNFSRAGQISNEQMKAISTLNDNFARNLMHTGGAWLRTEFVVKLASGEQMPYAEYLGRVPDRTYMCSVRLEPIGAMGLLEFDLSLACPIIDLLLGGTGKVQETRPLTDIEELIMVSVMQLFVKELNAAWQPVGLQFVLESRETTAQIARMLPPGEKTLCVCFEVTMPEAQGVLNLCMPATVLNTILRRLLAERNQPKRRAPEIRNRMAEMLADVPLGAVLQFPSVSLNAREVANMKPGSVLRLPLPRHAAAELRIGGLAYGTARAVRMGEHRGARIEPTPNEGEVSQRTN